jgi:type IV secretory pathway VirJ component
VKSYALTFTLFATACITMPPPPGVLPTVERDARGHSPSPYFVVFVTGDGGWRKIDIKVSDVLRDAGMPVVGLLANHYFARERTPEETGADLDKLIREYQTKWQRQKVILIGYSRGAEALPFMVNRLSDDAKRSVALIVLLGPGDRTGFGMDAPDRFALLPEVQQLKDTPLVCVNGTLEKDSLCRSLQPGQATVLAVKGGHHFGGDYDRIAQAVLGALK